jgi:membrane protein YqaA with SNARE-associated domain
MIELLRGFSHWIEGFADSPWAVVILVVNSFSESIFNPIPPDPLLIGMAVINPNLALVYAGLVTISSVLGALVGHWLGLRFGRPLVLRFISVHKVDRVEAMFLKYGSWAILIAAFTPIPYKVFAISAGVLEMDRRPFLVVSIIGRGARFFLLGGLIFFFGEAMQDFIETRFEILTLLFSILLVVSLVTVFMVLRWRRSNGVPSLEGDQSLGTDLELR